MIFVTQIEQIKNQLSDFFEETPFVRVFLFGSTARNEANATSDIDLAVELLPNTMIGLIAFIKIADKLEIILNKKVDLVCLDAISPYILPFFEKDKILIYERKNGR